MGVSFYQISFDGWHNLIHYQRKDALLNITTCYLWPVFQLSLANWIYLWSSSMYCSAFKIAEGGCCSALSIESVLSSTARPTESILSGPTWFWWTSRGTWFPGTAMSTLVTTFNTLIHHCTQLYRKWDCSTSWNSPGQFACGRAPRLSGKTTK